MSKSDNSGKRILVIDDNPAILEMFRELLGEEGYGVALHPLADDIATTLEVIREAAPHLVVLDPFTGGELDGWQLLEATRREPDLCDTPLIVCTSPGQELLERDDVLRRLRVAVVPKPFDIDHLLAVIQELLTVDAARKPSAGADDIVGQHQREAV